MTAAREGSSKGRETFDVSLDGRQIASIVVGALVLLGIVFVLGLNVGRQLAIREVQAERGDDALAALDRPPAPPEAPVRQESLTFHDRLTKERPAEASDEAAPPAAIPVAAPPAAVAAAKPAPAVAAKPAPAPAAKAAAPKAAPAKASGGAWSVQVGATQDRAEAERIASRFKGYRARVESAAVPGRKGTWYRVRVGSFDSKDAAGRYAKDLARETGVKGYVASNP